MYNKVRQTKCTKQEKMNIFEHGRTQHNPLKYSKLEGVDPPLLIGLGGCDLFSEFFFIFFPGTLPSKRREVQKKPSQNVSVTAPNSYNIHKSYLAELHSPDSGTSQLRFQMVLPVEEYLASLDDVSG